MVKEGGESEEGGVKVEWWWWAGVTDHYPISMVKEGGVVVEWWWWKGGVVVVDPPTSSTEIQRRWVGLTPDQVVVE